MAQRNSNKKIYCNSNKVLSKVLPPFILLLIINILLISCGLDPASGSRDVTALALEKEKSEVLAKIRGGSCIAALENASAALREDKEVILAAVNGNGLALEYASEALRADREVAVAAVNTKSNALRYVSETLKEDKKFLLAVVKKFVVVLIWGNEALRANREFVLAAVKQNGLALEYASEALSSDREVVLAAVKQNGDSLLYADETLQADKEVVLAAVEFGAIQDLCDSPLRYASETLQADKEMVLAAVKKNGIALQYASETLKADKEFALAVIEVNKFSNAENYFKYFSEALQADREVVLVAVKSRGFVLKDMSEALRADKEIVLAAIKETGKAFYHASEALQADNEVVLAAVSEISKIQSCLYFYELMLTKIHKNKFWESKENRIALLQSARARNKEKLLSCIRQLEEKEELEVEPISQVEANTPIAAVGVLDSPLVNIHAYTSQQDYYQVTFGTLAGQQYTISIPVDATIDQLAVEMRNNLNQDRDEDNKKQYWHIVYGDDKISPVQGADLVSTIFN
jgi:hypothetical protein